MKRVFIILLGLLAAVTARSQALSALLIPTDSRSLAMGGTMVPRNDGTLDAGAYWGIWAPRFADNTVAGIDASVRFGDLDFFLEGTDFIDKPYDISELGGSKGTFRPYDLILSLGASYNVIPGLSAGAKLRSVISSLADNAAGSVYCCDVFAVYGTQDWFASLSVRNLGGTINYGGADWSLPGLIALDGSWSPLSGLRVAANTSVLFSGSFMAGAGAEYCLADIVTFRGGFHYGDPRKALPTFGSLGIGAKYAGISLDAAYLIPAGTPGGSLMIRLGYSF